MIFSLYGELHSQRDIIREDQRGVQRSESDTSKVEKPVIQFADSHKIDATTDTTIQYLQGNVRMYHDGVYFQSDTAQLSEHLFTASGEVSIQKGDSLKLFSDSLRYLPDSLMAYFYGRKQGDVVLKNMDNELFTNYLIYDRNRELVIYPNTGLLISPDAKIKSRKGIYHVNGKYANFYEKVTVEGKDYTIYSDSLRFYSESKFINFLTRFKIVQEGRIVVADGGTYDTQSDIGEFIGNAQVIEGKDTFTAEQIYFDNNTGDVKMYGQANYKGEKEYGSADTILYNQKTENADLIGTASYFDGEQKVDGETIAFNKATDALKVTGDGFLSSAPYLISAADLDYKKDSMAMADGDVIWIDTSELRTVYADHVRHTDSTKYTHAYNDSLKVIVEDVNDAGDTMYIQGKSVITYEDIVDGDTSKVFSSSGDVDIILEDASAISDSMIFLEKDSIITLYDNPIMWSDSSQYKADTIVLYLANEKIHKVDLLGNAVILSETKDGLYNQLKGRRATAVFQDDKIHKLEVNEEAHSIYYIEDDEGYIGSHNTKCNRIVFSFDDGELDIVKFYDKTEQTLTPMKEVNPDTNKVDGFLWNPQLKPLLLLQKTVAQSHEIF